MKTKFKIIVSLIMLICLAVGFGSGYMVGGSLNTQDDCYVLSEKLMDLKFGKDEPLSQQVLNVRKFVEDTNFEFQFTGPIYNKSSDKIKLIYLIKVGDAVGPLSWEFDKTQKSWSTGNSFMAGLLTSGRMMEILKTDGCLGLMRTIQQTAEAKF